MKHLICLLGVAALGALPAHASLDFGLANNISLNGGTAGGWTEIDDVSGQQIVCVVAIGNAANVCGNPGPSPSATSIPITAPGAGTLPGGITNYLLDDGAPQYGAPVYTDLTGLTSGDVYTLQFYQASSEENSGGYPDNL